MTQLLNSQIRTKPVYDLEERTFKFAKDVRDYTKTLPKGISNHEYAKQLIRSSGSQAANYIEANESLSKKDFILRIKICKKEIKETILWLRLTEVVSDHRQYQDKLIQEATELTKIFGRIIENSLNKRI